MNLHALAQSLNVHLMSTLEASPSGSLTPKQNSSPAMFNTPATSLIAPSLSFPAWTNSGTNTFT